MIHIKLFETFSEPTYLKIFEEFKDSDYFKELDDNEKKKFFNSRSEFRKKNEYLFNQKEYEKLENFFEEENIKWTSYRKLGYDRYNRVVFYHNDSKAVCISPISDDYFIVYSDLNSVFNTSQVRRNDPLFRKVFKCDQIDGLIYLIKKIFL